MRSYGSFLLLALGLVPVAAAGPSQTAPATPERFLIHVKTALSVDDAQICVVPNIAWAALEAGHEVRVLFDGSAVTSVARGFGWRGWLGVESTAMDRAPLPERERTSLSEQLGVPVEQVPEDYGAYLHFLKDKGVKLFYNRTMTVLYGIDAGLVDPALEPLGLQEMVDLLAVPAVYVVY